MPRLTAPHFRLAMMLGVPLNRPTSDCSTQNINNPLLLSHCINLRLRILCCSNIHRYIENCIHLFLACTLPPALSYTAAAQSVRVRTGTLRSMNPLAPAGTRARFVERSHTPANISYHPRPLPHKTFPCYSATLNN